MKTEVANAVRRDLSQNIDKKTKDNAQRFFKEEVKFHGVKTSIVRQIARKHFNEIKDREKKDIFNICEALLESDYGEEAYIAFEWAYNIRKRYDPADFYVFERWIQIYVNNWAKCDTLCNHTMGSYIEQFPECLKDIKNWAKSDNRWFRRASAVSLIIPARNGKFLDDIFEISDLLLRDKDDLVQKGYGWLLKEASKKHQKEVYEYITNNKTEMPRTALRYALEKMPEELRRTAMKK
jgi:3-methyladenine DNA glycosylase AlkD